MSNAPTKPKKLNVGYVSSGPPERLCMMCLHYARRPEMPLQHRCTKHGFVVRTMACCDDYQRKARS